MDQQEMFANARNFGIKGGNFTNIRNQTKVIASPTGNSHLFRRVQELSKKTIIGLDLLLRYSVLSARLDSSARIDPGRCNPATRVAVTKGIIDWIESDNPASSMMRILGAAGAGKTALAQSIGELCKERGWLAASFFVSRTAPGRNNGFTIIPTIAYQLASSYPEARHFIRNRVENDPSLLDQSMQTIMEKLIIDPLSSWWCKGSGVLKSFVSIVQPRLIMIDGLDECDDPNIQCEIIRVVAMATQQLRRHPVRFLITSRPESHILHTFRREPIFRSIGLITIDLENLRDAEHDIEIFLTHSFEAIKLTHILSPHLPDAWPGTGAISALAKKASGQFIYASVVMKYVASDKHDPRYRLEVVLGNSLQPTHDTPFSHLDALYSHIFSTVNSSNIPLVRQILGFMVIPRTDSDGFGEYTSPKMLETLLSLAKGSVYILLADLRSLISMDGDYSEPMKFFHASLSDFLLDSTRSGKFLVSLRMAHETLAKEYLRLIPSASQQPHGFHYRIG
jgi:hypothetical protein